jgi:hypothetical protein
MSKNSAVVLPSHIRIGTWARESDTTRAASTRCLGSHLQQTKPVATWFESFDSCCDRQLYLLSWFTKANYVSMTDDMHACRYTGILRVWNGAIHSSWFSTRTIKIQSYSLASHYHWGRNMLPFPDYQHNGTGPTIGIIGFFLDHNNANEVSGLVLWVPVSPRLYFVISSFPGILRSSVHLID